MTRELSRARQRQVQSAIRAAEGDPAQPIGASLPQTLRRRPLISRSLRIDLEERKKAATLPARHFAREIKPHDCWRKTRDGIANQLGSGFLLAVIGGRGPGKTQIAVDVCKAALAAGLQPRHVDAMTIFLDIRASFKQDSELCERDVIAAYCSPHLLVIDEIQERGETDFERRILNHIINQRYNAMRDTLVVGNLNQPQLELSLGPSIVSRMNETGGIIVCGWKSFREHPPREWAVKPEGGE